MGITKEEVFQAAEALAARGVSVTNQAVREHLGGRGSFSTLAPHLRAWHDGRTAARKEAHTPAPSEVGAGWTRTLDSLWSAALAQARRLAHVEHEAQVAATHAALEEAHAEIARLEAEGQRREEERTAAVTRADAEHAAALDLRMELGAARERAAAADARVNEETRRREDAEKERAAAREETAQMRGALSVLEQQRQTR
jgi:colicin import membrane protein